MSSSSLSLSSLSSSAKDHSSSSSKSNHAAAAAAASPSAGPVPAALPRSSAPRGLPPPRWTPEETTALIHAYRDKWYALGRGNLRASHWQEIADEVALMGATISAATRPKNALQCRHKMEKLRKRYHLEAQRARSNASTSRFNSLSWAHFKSMDSMEKGLPNPRKNLGPLHREDQQDDNNEQNLYEKFMKINAAAGAAGAGGSKQYSGSKVVKVGDKRLRERPTYSSFARGGGATRPVTELIVKERSGGSREREREGEPVNELANAIKLFGDRYVRMEQKKMEVAREIETMRMEMEAKRTKLFLESQERIVEAFAKAISKNNEKMEDKNKNKNVTI